jgi:protein-tyrosine phosphatase
MSTTSSSTPAPPVPSLREELARLLGREPELGGLIHPHPGEPDQIRHEILCREPVPYAVVHVPVPHRRGRLWVSRLPGFHRPQTASEVDALGRAGVGRVVCLVPEEALDRVHHADRYLRLARARWGAQFHLVGVPDHGVPPDDGAFRRCVRTVDAGLHQGEGVLVHCLGGCGRSGMFVACLLVRAGMAPGEAIRTFRAHRRCGPETAEQVAYVFRYAQVEGHGDGVGPFESVDLRICAGEDGMPRELARGGLSRVMVGRLRVGPGRWRRVAVKRFVYAVDDPMATRLAGTIRALRQAGVRLPRMSIVRMGDGRWVQVSPLFGSSGRGSKLDQRAAYHRQLAEPERRFAIDQLTRVANAGHMPSLDLFLTFTGDRPGILPLDLDLIVPEPDCARIARKLLHCLIQVGRDADDRDRLLEVARDAAAPAVEGALGGILDHERDRYRGYWSME